jgi:hypothetical protein
VNLIGILNESTLNTLILRKIESSEKGSVSFILNAICSPKT